MTELIVAVILGIVEGMTEFLPVSSTGHLILASELLGYNAEQWAMFNVVIQLGAILAVIVLYWRTFWAVAMGLIQLNPVSWRFLRNLVIAFIPAAGLGLALHDKIELLLASPKVVAWALIIGGIAILVIERLLKSATIVGIAEIPVVRVIGIGLIQCLAMIPGVSRSGATIMGALSLGVDRRTVHRMLAREGHTFTSVLETTRRDLAERMVRNPNRSLTEVAETLAFSSHRNFTRWFRSQFGCSPSQWRSRAR
jgi:undecaprenyl-diphosphatase